MQISELASTHRQLGNKILELKDGKINGYEITAYEGYMPKEVKFVGSIDNPTTKVVSAETAYDQIFGKPEAPNFNNVLNV